MKFTYTKSAFEIPDGKYAAKFLGVTLRDDKPGDRPRLGQDGKPLPPAMTWDFEIVEGEQVGKKCDKMTGRVPTPKSGCGKLLAAIADAVLGDGTEVDIENYAGQVYRITVQENRVSDSPPPMRVYDWSQAASGPPPDGARWDYSDGQDVVANATTADVKTFLADCGPAAAKIRVKPAGAPKEQAKLAGEFPEFAAAEPAATGAKQEPF